MIQISNELLSKHLLEKSRRSHRIMIWCGIFIYPAFGFLDFLLVEAWRDFIIVRLSGVALLSCLLIYDNYFKISPTTLAQLACQIVINSLMWMLSQIDNPHIFAIYTINSCTGYIASALFLFWKPLNSIVLLVLNMLFFIFFISVFSPLTWGEAVVNGSFLLFSIAIMSQFYIFYRCKAVKSDFKVQQQLTVLNNELWTKNQQIEMQSTEIMKKNKDLEQLNILKDKLFIIISHDLRAPLQSLKGVLDLINKSVTISADEFKFLTRGVKAKVDLTYNLMENLLFWTRSQMTGFKVKPSSVNLSNAVNECISLLHSIAEKKRIQILNQTCNEHFVKTDPDMLRLVIRNILMNAIKFSYEEGIIDIKSTKIFNEIEISITDNGIGMSQEETSKLFSSQQQNISKVGTSNETGTGLGLMLCKEFIEMNNGRLWVLSDPGKGSDFHFVLSASQVEDGSVYINSDTKVTD